MWIKLRLSEVGVLYRSCRIQAVDQQQQTAMTQFVPKRVPIAVLNVQHDFSHTREEEEVGDQGSMVFVSFFFEKMVLEVEIQR